MTSEEHLRYPIGRFQAAANYSIADLAVLLERFRNLPDLIKAEAERIEAAGLWGKSYRPGGWTALQVIHHLTDSHLNAYQRMKLTLTEEHPTLRPYDEQAWALLADNQLGYFVSHQLLTCLHERLYHTLKDLSSEQWERSCYHPANDEVSSLAQLFATYDWHGRHHLGHLRLIN